MSATGSSKVVLLGEGRVGKTSLIKRYTDDAFSDHVAPTTPPVGASCWNKKRILVDPALVVSATKRIAPGTAAPALGGQPVPLTLNLWDTAGQERFHALGPIYYRGAEGALLVYDVTDPDSFRKAKVWADELRTVVGSGVALAVAGNKVDLPERSRAVSRAEAEAWCAEIGAVHYETSAKAGRGVEQAFVGLSAEILARRGSGRGLGDPRGGIGVAPARLGGGGVGGSTGLVLGGGPPVAADGAPATPRKKGCC